MQRALRQFRDGQDKSHMHVNALAASRRLQNGTCSLLRLVHEVC